MLCDNFKMLNEKRRSIRQFLPDKVPDEDVKFIIDAARLAPSAGNSQPWRFIAVRNKNVINRMAEVVDKKVTELYPLIHNKKVIKQLDNYKFYYTLFNDAPLVLAVIGETSKTFFTKINDKFNLNVDYKKNINPDILSLGACIQNSLLAVASLEYGSTWMTGPIRFAQDELEEILQIKGKEYLVSLIAIGKPLGQKKCPPKKSLDEILEFID